MIKRHWSISSLDNLETCHPELKLLANSVLQVHDCSVLEGYRSKQKQNNAYKDKLSRLKWPNSKHNVYPSEAIHLAPCVRDVEPYDYEYVLYFSGLVLGIAEMLYAAGWMRRKVRWGGNWSTQRDKNYKLNEFFDGVHFELEKDNVLL